MELEHFKEYADEQLADLVADERMVKRIRQQICSRQIRPRARAPRAAVWLAASCACVMLLSGGVLIHLQKTRSDSSMLTLAASAEESQSVVSYDAQEVLGASMLSSTLTTSRSADGTVVTYGIESVGEYSEGYAPALATNGLYGYVDESENWVIDAIYDEAGKVADGKADVVLQGVSSVIEVP